MLITVIGSGYVGLVSAVCLAEMGHQVVAVDSDSDKITALTRGEVPIYEPLLPELLRRHTGKRLLELLLCNGARTGWFSVASNPEFLREGSAVTDFLYPDRIVIGADDEFSSFMLREVYRPLSSGSYYRREDAVPCPARARPRTRLLLTSAKSAE